MLSIKPPDDTKSTTTHHHACREIKGDDDTAIAARGGLLRKGDAERSTPDKDTAWTGLQKPC